jgi:hypothetical protein
VLVPESNWKPGMKEKYHVPACACAAKAIPTSIKNNTTFFMSHPIDGPPRDSGTESTPEQKTEET